MQLPDSYYEDEVREGFYIPSMGKKAWAAELAVLREVDRICIKHNIQYFAEWGTLLGAIRHGGFIPWDDDMDIAMKRADYEKFLKVAPQELPEGFAVFNLRNHDNFWYFLARVVNTSRMRFEDKHLKDYHGFPYIAGLDIFVLDNVSGDANKEEQRGKVIEYVLTVADSLDDVKLNGATKEAALDKIEKLCKVKLVNRRNNQLLKRELYSVAEKLFCMFDDTESDCLTQIMPCGLYGNKMWLPREYYEKSIRVPFENTTIPVPVAYDKMLQKRYGDYTRLVRNSGGHNYPFYATQQKSLDELMDFELPKYKYNKEVRRQDDDSNHKGYRKDVSVYLNALDKEICNVENTMLSDKQQCIEHLQESQRLSIELGELIEKVKGEGNAVISKLEDYCERIYQLYCGFTEEAVCTEELCVRLENLKSGLKCVHESVSDNILNRREVVFLPYKADLWNGFRSLWQQYANDFLTDVYVVALPYYYKDYAGNFVRMQYEPKLYPNEINVISYEDFDLKLHHPDIVFIQNPYDEWNTETSVPPQYYSSEIVNQTKKLVYIPAFKLYEFGRDNYREYLNMDAYVKMPGVCNADEIIVQSENMRQLYIEKLVEFAGEDTREIWERKIKGTGLPVTDSERELQEKTREDMLDDFGAAVQRADGTYKKIVVYYIGISGLIEYKQRALDKIQSVIDTFGKYNDDIMLVICQNKLIKATLQDMAPSVYGQYDKLIDKCLGLPRVIDGGNYEEEKLAAFADAYYGDTSPLMQKFRALGKPVMIQSVDV